MYWFTHTLDVHLKKGQALHTNCYLDSQIPNRTWSQIWLFPAQYIKNKIENMSTYFIYTSDLQLINTDNNQKML